MDQSKSVFSTERVQDLILLDSEEDDVARPKMKQTDQKMSLKEAQTKAMILISLALALLASGGDAQETKGAGLKGGGLASAFKQNIVSLQQKQVIQPQPVLTNLQQSSFSSTLIKQQAIKPLVVNQQVSFQEEQVSQSGAADSEPAIYGSVSGTPGIDFPAFTSIPNTPFTCEGRPFDPGMYADESTGCQVYHLCYQGRRESFLCGVGTVFSQAIMNCDFWHSVDCSKSADFYHLNAEFGKSSGEPGATQQLQQAFAGKIQSSGGLVAPQVVSKTNIAVSNNQQSAILRPAAFSRVESSSEFNSRTSGATAPLGSTKGGFSKQQGSGFLSAAQQGRLTLEPSLGGQPDTSAQQSESAMSMSISKEAKQPAVANEALYGLKRPAQLRPGSGVKGGSQAASSDGFERLKLAPAADNGIAPSAANGDEWKPYFKSKSSPRPLVPTTSAPPTSPSPATTQPTPPAQPDQEPVFSSNRDEAQEKPSVPKSSSPPAESQAETPGSTSTSAAEVEATSSPEGESKSAEESATSTTTSTPSASSAESSTESSSAAPTEGATSSASSESTSKSTEIEETSSPTPGVEYEGSTTSAESKRKRRS